MDIKHSCKHQCICLKDRLKRFVRFTIEIAYTAVLIALAFMYVPKAIEVIWQIL